VVPGLSLLVLLLASDRPTFLRKYREQINRLFLLKIIAVNRFCVLIIPGKPVYMCDYSWILMHWGSRPGAGTSRP